MRVGADSGGTFTDVVTSDGRITKVPSTPEDPGSAVRVGLAESGTVRPEMLAHGTTVATNALLEGTLARVALVTTAGFGDTIEIARQDRPSLYDPWADRPAPLVARRDRLEVLERIAADGAELVALEVDRTPVPDTEVDAVAVVLLHSDVFPTHEQQVAAWLRRRGWDVTASHEVSPEFREYERTVTTVVNAALRPVCAAYLEALDEAAHEVVVMTSAGALVDIDRASVVPAALLFSGPAAGARAAAAVATACGFPDAIGFDMGGTSTDVCLIRSATPEMAAQQYVGGYPVRLPSLDIHTVGAGGGSIAHVDPGGALQVGPRSAGAVPGPACYGRGGEQATVTDANLLAGRIPAGTAFSGLGALDRAAAGDAMGRSGASAEGVLAVVNTTMAQALKKVSVERGVDPAGLALVAFGGAGPLHACELAEELGVAAVIVPAMAGVLSAVGLLTSPLGVDLARSWPTPLDHGGLAAEAERLAGEARSILARSGSDGGSGRVEVHFDCRYSGQSHDLRVESIEAFHEEHRRVNGYARPGDPIEVTAVRVALIAAAPMDLGDVMAPMVGSWGDDVVTGPRVVSTEDCTIWVPEGWEGSEGAFGSLVLRRVGDSG